MPSGFRKKGFTSLSLSFWARKLTLLWNSAKFVACRGTAIGDIPAPGRVMRQRLREPNNSVCLFIFLNLGALIVEVIKAFNKLVLADEMLDSLNDIWIIN